MDKILYATEVKTPNGIGVYQSFYADEGITEPTVMIFHRAKDMTSQSEEQGKRLSTGVVGLMQVWTYPLEVIQALNAPKKTVKDEAPKKTVRDKKPKKVMK